MQMKTGCVLNTHFAVVDIVDVDDAFITLDIIVNGDVVDVVAVDENRRSKTSTQLSFSMRSTSNNRCSESTASQQQKR